jgi:hypothetical protein
MSHAKYPAQKDRFRLGEGRWLNRKQDLVKGIAASGSNLAPPQIANS